MVSYISAVHNGELTADDWIDVLEGAKPKRGGVGFMALCPAHDDRNPSLSVDPGNDGKILVKCFAGCEYEDIRRAAGLERNGSPKHPALKTKKTSGRSQKVYTFAGVHKGPQVFPFYAPNGTLLYVQRHKGPYFHPIKDDGSEWMAGQGDAAPVPYNLPGLLEGVSAGETVYHVEGCKDVDTARVLGLCATTSGGSETWRQEYRSFYTGADVAIIPDNDEPGRAYAKRVAEDLHETARRVRIVTLPDLPEGGDLTDWMEAGGAVEDLCALVEAAPVYTSPTDVSDVSDVFSTGEDENAVPAFPVDALPPKVARYVREAAASLSCPPDMVAIPAIGALSGVIGRTREIRVKRG